MNGAAELVAVVAMSGAWVSFLHGARVARRVARRCSFAVHRVIGPCDSCGWPVARGHRPTCTGR